ncbi:ribonuclease HII [Bacillus rubiinfantis]|uniref:ribonuclease HII n=1 Tax=Bacillus rubiinfantis TaxID=1499680 RepID=UPI0005A77601|nr:ribonuclease HII [Bacillus rubiinfantis]
MKRLSALQIEEKLAHIHDESDPYILEIEQDTRLSVQRSLAKWKRMREKERLLQKKFQQMTKYEERVRSKGFQLIAGVDEVGRGPLAGPVVVAAVILPADFYLPGIDDSKKLSVKKREEFADIIRKEAISISTSMIHANEIDEINIYEATKKAMKSAVASLHTAPEFILIDAMKLDLPYPSESIIKGDAKSVSIAAASIIAKTTRDHFMEEISQSFPDYGFQHHMGYGTKEHLEAIQKYGITPYHRRSFAPIKELITPDLFSFDESQ